MYGELHGKVAVVTGAATGLGLFITLRYILEGMNVVADYVGEVRLKNLKMFKPSTQTA